MPSYSTPGVYIEEIAVFPPSIAPVATAIPAFIGFTEKALGKGGESLTSTAVRITSLLEYEEFFGKAKTEALTVTATTTATGVDVKWTTAPAKVPTHLLYYSMQLYFANGGGPCYVYSLGGYGVTATDTLFKDAILALEAVDEPTLLAFPDAVHLDVTKHGGIVDAALTSCNKMQDRFTIADVHDAWPNPANTTAPAAKVTSFRAKVTKTTVEFLKYGAAYFPFLSTSVPYQTAEANVAVTVGTATTTVTMASLNGSKTAIYAAVQSFLSEAYVTLPPSAAVAGIYAQVDRTRGVSKAPANVGLSLVVGPAIPVTNDLQNGLNIDVTSGKSVNAIRAFFGKGTLVWGARTFAGNDNEWRYVNVRRCANFIEESVNKAIAAFVFEPNDANTWVKVRTMIENFLLNQWRDGALMGAKPDEAFRVAVGLGQTMSAQDVLDGYMIVQVHLAFTRPAEFIRLQFMQKMPQS